jgi:hypothetical protein
MAKERKGPSAHAAMTTTGTIAMGNDGVKWIVKDVGRGRRWVRLKE